MQLLLRLAGLAQLGLVAGSLFVPKVLNWQTELGKVPLLLKQMFWTYAAYIVVINVCFGLVSLFCYRDLAGGTTMAVLINGFIAAYWVSRVAVQFFYFERSAFPSGRWFMAGEAVLVTLFAFLSVIYSLATYFNLQAL